MSESALLDALDDLFFVFDATGTAVRWNRAVVDTTGYSDEELAAMTPTDFFADDDANRVAEAVAEVIESGEATVEASVVTAGGERIPYEVKARRLAGDDSAAFAGIGRDISQRIGRREQIENRERVLREMYEIIADRRRPFTEQVEALLRLGREELGTDYGTLSKIEGEEYVFEVVDAEDDSIRSGDVVPLSATNCEIAVATEQTLVLGDVARDAPGQTDRAGYAEWGIACYIGTPVFVDDGVHGTFCFYDTDPRDGQFSEWEVTLVDMMGRWVSYEIQRREAKELLQRQNEKLERFASLVSHDLRNPLNVLGGSIELARERGDLDELDRAHRAVERMDTLIENLLTLARSGAVIDETERVDLGSLVERCWEHVETSRAAIEIDTERTVRADESRLQQLIENLIRNSVEHGSTDSRAGPDDTVERGGDTVTVTVGDLPDGFYVEDDGPGIPESERENVFESGYTTRSGGTGFGLAIVGEIADAHGWDVRVTEGSEGGARVEFTGVSG